MWHYSNCGRDKLCLVLVLLDQPKFDVFQVDKATIQVVEWHLKVIFGLLRNPKFEFGEVEKAMFQVVARHWDHIFSF